MWSQMGLLSNQTGKILIEQLKKINPDFKTGIMYSDVPFNFFEGVKYGSLVFGTRSNGGKGAVIGDSENLYLAIAPNNVKVVSYKNIRSLNTSASFPYKKITLSTSEGTLEFKVDSVDCEYVVRHINTYIDGTISIPDGCDYSKWKEIKFKVIASDLPKEFELDFENNKLCFKKKKDLVECVYISGEVADIQQITEENKQSLLKKAGWGVVGGVVGGIIAAPLAVTGLLAGVIAKGNKKEVSFACELKSGHKFVAVADSNNYQKLLTQLYMEK